MRPAVDRVCLPTRPLLWATLGLLLLTGCLRPAGIRYPGLPALADGALHMVHVDVGQADALLLLYRGKSLLIDCGAPGRDPLRLSQRLPRRLDALLGTRHLDYVLLTHYHQDHVGAPGRRKSQRLPSGLFSLLERDGVTIGTILDRGFWKAGEYVGATQRNYQQAVGGWITSGVVGARREVRAGDRIDLGPGLNIEVVAASGNGYLERLAATYPTFLRDHPPSENDYSIALKVSVGEFEMFTGGDLSGFNVVRRFGGHASSYNDLESLIADRVGAVEIYRVNHHGSRNSTNPCFTAVLHPQVSIFSTGPNGYGHPDPEVFARVAAFGDTYITGGTAADSPPEIVARVVGDDVEVLVAPDGSRFWVNGKAYQSRTDAEEQAAGARAGCVERELALPDLPGLPVIEQDWGTD